MTIHEQLIAAGVKYKKDLLVTPMVAFADIKSYFNTITGVQGKIIAGTLNNTSEFRPYITAKGATDNTTITPREMENFKGDLVEEFDPSVVLGTLYTEKSSTRADKYDIAGKVALVIAMRASEKLVNSIFTAVRNPAGATTATLYNGFDKLVDIDIAASKISAALGNYHDLSATTLTSTNVGDQLKARYRALNSKLKKGCKLYIPVSILEMYEDWFQTEYGHVAWNEGTDQKYLVGTGKKCELIALTEMEDGKYLYFTKKENICLLFDQESDTESVEIRRADNPKIVQMYMITYFGVGFDTIDKEFFLAVKYTA